MRSDVVIVVQDGEDFAQFTKNQGELIIEAFYFLTGWDDESDTRLRLGISNSETKALIEIIRIQLGTNNSYILLKASHLHAVYCALLSSTQLTPSEEAYNVRTGWFKEHAFNLAEGISKAVRL